MKLKKRVRIVPEEGLKQPLRSYAETFSAVTVIKQMFPEVFEKKEQ